MNYSLVRQERISKLEKKLTAIQNALTNYKYTNKKDWFDDWKAFVSTEKELQIQIACLQNENPDFLSIQ